MSDAVPNDPPELPHGSPKRHLGALKGQVWIAPDFDRAPEEVLAAFEGEPDRR